MTAIRSSAIPGSICQSALLIFVDSTQITRWSAMPVRQGQIFTKLTSQVPTLRDAVSVATQIEQIVLAKTLNEKNSIVGYNKLALLVTRKSKRCRWWIYRCFLQCLTLLTQNQMKRYKGLNITIDFVNKTV